MPEPTTAGAQGGETRLREIEERVNAASVGPWVLDSSCQRGTVYCDDALGSAVATCHHQYTPTSLEQEDRNAHFIAHAREDVPWLVSRVRELEAQLATRLSAGGDRREPEGGTPLERIAKLPRYSPSVAYESGGPAEYAGMEEDIDGGWLDRDEALGAAASPSVEPGDRERDSERLDWMAQRTVIVDPDYSDHEIAAVSHSPIVHDDPEERPRRLRDEIDAAMKSEAAADAAALSRPESDHAE